MNKINSDTKDFINDFIKDSSIEDSPIVKYILYGGGFVVSIWALGKACKLLADAVTNFKHLHNAFKQ